MESLLTQSTNYLLAQSWQIAVLTIVVAFISFLLRNKSAHVRYLLWMIVLAKCLIPPLYTISIAILPEKEEVAYTAAPPIAENTTYEYRVPDIAITEPSKPAPVHFEIRALLSIGWFIGVFAMLFYYLVNALRTQIWLHKRRKELPGEFKKNIESLFKTFGVHRMPRLWFLDKISQPFVWGLVRGNIYLPAELINEKHIKLHTSLIGHELSHVIRFDALINSLQVIAQTIFWFHPFIWWTNRKIRTEREKCCDEMTIARLNALPEDYSEAIVEILAAKYEQSRRVPSLAVAGRIKNIEERIKTMLRPGKKFYKHPSIAAALFILFIALLTIPTAFVLTARAQIPPLAQPAAQPAADGEGSEQPRYAARTFNSKLAFDVFVLTFQSAFAPRRIGQTPSTAPLEIPACRSWGVRPLSPVSDWDSVIHEMNEQKIPGLRLRPATDDDLSHLAGLTGLQYLNLTGTRITDAALEYLKGLSGLRELLLLNTNITDEGLTYLKDLTRLQVLYLFNDRITDAGLEQLTGLSELQELSLSGTKITGSGMAHLEGLTHLQSLSLRHNSQFADMTHLRGLSELHTLDLTGTPITDAGLSHLKGLTGLRMLSLANTQITDAGLSHLNDLTGLQILSLANTQITDAALTHLRGLSELHTLFLDEARITDAGLKHLKTLSGLRTLALPSTQITDEGLEILKDLKYKGPNKWEDGNIYDPEKGKIYKCKAWMKEGKLKFRGFIGFSLLGRTTTWERQ